MAKKQNTNRARYQRIADALACLLDCELDLTDELNQALIRQMEALYEEADCLHPDVVRRLYPLLRALADERASVAGMDYRQWAKTNDLYGRYDEDGAPEMVN